MKRITLRIIGLLIISLFVLLAGCGNSSSAVAKQHDLNLSASPASEQHTNSGGTPAFVGTWIRQGTYTNGELMGNKPATLILTKNSFDSRSSACSNSGDLSFNGDYQTWTVKKSDCPSTINVGSVVRERVVVDGDTLTLINDEWGAEVKEVYKRSS